MTINAKIINTGSINSASDVIYAQGLILSFEQSIEVLAVGSILTFEQTVNLKTTAEGLILSFEQSVVTKLIYPLITFEQTVVDQDAPSYSFFRRNDWYTRITIDGSIVPDRYLRGSWNYIHNESNNALFDFSIQPDLGIQDLYQYQGSAVTCDVITANGTFRIFTGYIDIPVIDVMNEWITLQCSDNRESRFAAGEINPASIGYYSTSVFGAADPNDLISQITNRLSTVTSSLDWDGYGVPYLTPWIPKATADVTLSDSFVYRQQPQIRFESKEQIVNQVNINFTYNYQRFHAGAASYVWNIPYNGREFLTVSPSMLKKEMVESAIDAAGWPLRGSVGYTPVLKAGIYNIGGVTVVWSTTQTQYTVVPKTSTNPVPGGDPIPVTDNTGQPVYKAVATSATDLSDVFCFGAAWNAIRRWSQNITESYTLTVTAPQSIAAYGLSNKTQSASFTDIDNSASWDDSPRDNRSLAVEPYYNNQTLTLSEYVNATNTLINQARATILRSHRDTRCKFQRFIWPEIDLRHTVELSTTRIDCRGKVVGIKHNLNIGTGEAYSEIDLALFRATGSQAETPLVTPTRPADGIAPFSAAYALGSHYGLDPSVPAAVNWTGHIGNKYITERITSGFNTKRTQYQESFIVDTPDIPSAYRDQRTITTAATYNIAIPDNTLVYTTVGK